MMKNHSAKWYTVRRIVRIVFAAALVLAWLVLVGFLRGYYMSPDAGVRYAVAFLIISTFVVVSAIVFRVVSHVIQDR